MNKRYLNDTLKRLGWDKQRYFTCSICNKKIEKKGIGGFMPLKTGQIGVICTAVECAITVRAMDLLKER